MPYITLDRQQYPSWCELTRYDILGLESGQSVDITWTAPQCKLVVVRGQVTIGNNALETGAVHDAPRDLPEPDRHFTICAGKDGAVIVSLQGTWGENTGGSGVFTVSETANPLNRGDPADYPRNTSFDNHFHDCDEYWIIVEGAGQAVSEGTIRQVQAGNCVITGAGDHHDFPLVTTPVRAVFFETTLLGKQRQGHLWEHTHGPATPLRPSPDTGGIR